MRRPMLVEIKSDIRGARQIQESILKKSIVDVIIPEKSVGEVSWGTNIADLDARKEDTPWGMN